MKEKFITYSDTFNLLNDGDRIVVGVSGGVDSTVLLHLLSGLTKAKKLEIFVAHVNHGLRKTATLDEEFVLKLAKKYGFKFFCLRLTPPKSNIEEKLREKRYAFLNDVAAQMNATKILTAHHRDDNIETAVMNLLRGASFKGLSGMRLKSGLLVRPLLPFSKTEIVSYAKKSKLKWMEDETNKQNKYTRNKIRNSLLPYIESNIMPGFKENFFRLMMHSRETDDFMTHLAREELKKIEFRDGSLDLKEFRNLHRALQKEILKIKVVEKVGDLRSVGSAHLESAVRALSGEHSPKTIEFPRGLKIHKRSAKVLFELTKIGNKIEKI